MRKKNDSVRKKWRLTGRERAMIWRKGGITDTDGARRWGSGREYREETAMRPSSGEENPDLDRPASGRHRIPEAFRAFCIIVSFTAANTSRIFVVSVACVRCG